MRRKSGCPSRRCQTNQKPRVPETRSRARPASATATGCGPVAIVRALAQNHRPVLQFHRIKVINHFQKPGPHGFFTSSTSFSTPSTTVFLQFGFGDFRLRPVHAGHVGAEIQAQLRVVAEKFRHRQRWAASTSNERSPAGQSFGRISILRPAPPLRGATLICSGVSTGFLSGDQETRIYFS